MGRRFTLPLTVEEQDDMAQIRFQRPGLRILLHQCSECGTLLRRVRTIDLPMDELYLFPAQHCYCTRSRSVNLSRSRAVYRRDLTVWTGIPITSAISW